MVEMTAGDHGGDRDGPKWPASVREKSGEGGKRGWVNAQRQAGGAGLYYADGWG